MIGAILGIVSGIISKIKIMASANMTGALDANVTDTSILGTIISISDVSTFNRTTDSPEAIRNRIDAPPVSLYSGTVTGTIVEDGATGAPCQASVASSTSADIFGAWTQIDAAASADSWICSWSDIISEDIVTPVVLEIGTGAGASEVTKMRWSYTIDNLSADSNLQTRVFTLPIPIKVASGVRIAARASDGQAAAKTHVISVQYYQGLET